MLGKPTKKIKCLKTSEMFEFSEMSEISEMVTILERTLFSQIPVYHTPQQSKSDDPPNSDWRSARNMEPAIEIGIAQACLKAIADQNVSHLTCARSSSRPCWHPGTGACTTAVNLSNFEDIVVESNAVIVRRGNGTCERNGYSFGAAHTIDRNNSCRVATTGSST